jgi:recombination protein RecA
MPIARRPAQDNGQGGSNPPESAAPAANVRRPGTRRTKFALTGEIAEVASKLGASYAPGVIRRATDRSMQYGRVPTDIMVVDLALAGGFRLSRGSMIYGEKSTGKTTVALMTVAACQRMFPDSVCAWIDIEGTLDTAWAAKLGVDLDRLLVLEPETGEQAIDIADAVFRTAEVSCVVTDSIAMLVPMKEIEGSAEDSLPGIHARLVGNYIRRLNQAMLKERHRRHNPLLLHINQFRMKIGVMFGDPRTLPGGKALEFATSQQMLTTNKEHKGKDDLGNEVVVFNEHSFQITKDKTGGRIKEGKFKLIRDISLGYREGWIDQTKTILNFAAHAGLYRGGGSSHNLEVEGTTYNFRKHDEIGQYFFEHPDKQRAVMNQVLAFYRNRWGITS